MLTKGDLGDTKSTRSCSIFSSTNTNRNPESYARCLEKCEMHNEILEKTDIKPGNGVRLESIEVILELYAIIGTTLL